MHRIKRFVFWAGGVILPRPSDLVIDSLASDGVDAGPFAQEILALENQLAVGAVSGQDFRERIGELVGRSLAPDDLLSHSPESFRVPVGFEKIVDALRSEFELYLVSDYPREWLAHPSIHTRLSQWFEPQHTFFMPELKLPADYRGLLRALVEAGAIVPGTSLWVDYHPRRTMLAIREGIDAAVYVDAGRLYRDFRLWGFVPKDW